jgi:polyisoprenoid-binding protein YceI
MATAQGVTRTIHPASMKETHSIALLVVVTLLAQSLAGQAPTSTQELFLQLDSVHSGAQITLEGNLHGVEGSFTFKRGAIHYQPATGAASGEIVFDAASGKTGNDRRDRKMHKDVIESVRYPEITFHLDRADGTLAPSGESVLQVHGLFSIHGGEHEVTIPVQVNVRGNTFSAKASFTIPYVTWGMKNPSVVFLRVGNEVKVQFHAAGTLTP